MGLFGGKKKEVIPELSYANDSRSPAPSFTSQAPSYRTAPAYIPPSQGGGGYGQSSHYASQQQQQQQPQYGNGGNNYNGYSNDYATSQGAGQPAGGMRGAKPADLRSQLLSGGARAQSSGVAARDRYGNLLPQDQQQHEDEQRERTPQEEEDEEVEGIKQQMRFGKQESLASTRNAIRIARETEETARSTIDKLAEQSDRIGNTERHLDMAKAHNERAADEAKELKNLNKSIFRPSFTFNKNSKRDKEERRIVARHQEEQEEREQARKDQFESRQRIEGTYKSMDRAAENAAGAHSRAQARGAERSRYQFEATESDDEVEDEIDRNLNDMSDVVGRIKQLAFASGQEVDAQNRKLERLEPKVTVLSDKITLNTQRLGRIK